MKKVTLFLIALFVFASAVSAQSQEPRFIADTVTVQADATYEADPDLATLNFNVSVTEKQLSKAYERATEALQRIMQLAERNGLHRKDVTTGAFTVTPDIDWRDRKRKPKGYRVESTVVFRLRDFSKLGVLIDEAVESDIVEFRSLTFSLADEEEAKVRAVTLARDRAEARARAALGNGSKLGAPRIVTVDLAQPVQVARIMTLPLLVENDQQGGLFSRAKTAPPPPSVETPEKIRVRATVHCIFQIGEAAKPKAGE